MECALDVPVPTPNRLSILYADGKRRIVLDAAVVEHVQIHRDFDHSTFPVNLHVLDNSGIEHNPSLSIRVKNRKKTGEMNVAVPAGEEPQGDAPVEGQAEAATAQDGETEEEAEKPKSPVKGILVRCVHVVGTSRGGKLGTLSSAAAAEEDPKPKTLISSFKASSYNRLSEPKWVKSGQLEDWISTSPNKSRDGAETAEENWLW
jgi:hypothetical protein